MPDVTLELTTAQAAHLRVLAFEELEATAKIVADQCDGAAQQIDTAGEDAEGTYRSRFAVVVELLDLLGWATNGDGKVLAADGKTRIDWKAS